MPANDRFCNLLELCETPEAPICPIQEITIRSGVWYCDEPVCRSQMFDHVPWLKKQRAIAALGLKADRGFFTVSMLNTIRFISPDIKGADPDSPNPEKEWFAQRKTGTKTSAKSTGKRVKKKTVKKIVNKFQRKKLF